jgi:hypothetical protein
MKKLMMTTALAITMTCVGALAQPSQPADPHHPAGDASAPPAAAQAAPGAGGQAGMMGAMGGPQGMMGGMPMMHMMGMMQMMGGGDAPGMGMIDHVEGRIAFLRTELKITEAQTDTWNAFAVALRTNAQNLGAARRGMMGQMGAGRQQDQALAQRLDAQERWLTARLEGTRAIKTAFAGLYARLSDEQKAVADDLLAPNMGLNMAMMPMGPQGPMGRGGR